MLDIVNQPWFWPAVIVIVGLPLTLVILTEIHTALQRRGSPADKIVLLLRNYVAPVGALLILLTQVSEVNTHVTWAQIAATAFGFLVLLVLLNTLNYALFVTARQGTWRNRLPSIFVTIARLVLIFVGLALLFQWVWGADVGGLFAALGISSIIIGLALQNAVGGVISGLLVIFEEPFRIGEWIDVGDGPVLVEEINWRATHLRTAEGVRVIPNSSLASGSLTNLSRSGVPFTATTSASFAATDPPQLAMDVCLRVAEDLPQRLASGAPTVSAAGSGGVTVTVPIENPGDATAATTTFAARIWYAARRAGLSLDGVGPDSVDDSALALSALSRNAHFLQIGPDDFVGLLPKVRIEHYARGEVVHREAEVPDAIRFVVTGAAASVVTTSEGVMIRTITLVPGDPFGLTSVTRQGIAGTLSASSDLTVLVVPVAVLDQLVRTRPLLARDIGREIDNRTAAAAAAFAEAGQEMPSSARVTAY